MKYIKVVYCEWIDSETSQGWDEISADKMHLVYSVGIFLNETDQYVQIAHSLDPENGNANGTLKIPNVAIKKLRTLCQIQIKQKR